MVLGLTTETDVKAFWPEIVNEFPPDQLDSQIAYYIQRATYLINRVGSINLSVDNAADILKLATNIVVRRLVYWDKHPASTAEIANVTRESTSGLSYGLSKEPRTVEQILGDEVMALLSGGIIELDEAALLKSYEIVFEEALLHGKDLNGDTIRVYDGFLDDSFNSSWNYPNNRRLLHGTRRRGGWSRGDY
jgi:hypothetical protein